MSTKRARALLLVPTTDGRRGAGWHRASRPAVPALRRVRGREDPGRAPGPSIATPRPCLPETRQRLLDTSIPGPLSGRRSNPCRS